LGGKSPFVVVVAKNLGDLRRRGGKLWEGNEEEGETRRRKKGVFTFEVTSIHTQGTKPAQVLKA